MAKHIYDLFVQRIILLFSCQHTMFVIDLRVRLGQIVEIWNIYKNILVHLNNSNRLEYLVALQNHVAIVEVKKRLMLFA